LKKYLIFSDVSSGAYFTTQIALAISSREANFLKDVVENGSKPV
jgi:hypothetical protein